jgi:hypothetical protein
MNIIGNLAGDENGFIYDASSGRLYQKEVTWECDETPPSAASQTNGGNPYETPYWFKQWANNFSRTQQQQDSNTSPRWFLDWLNKVNFTTPSANMTPPPHSSNEMPIWFKDWLSKNPSQPQYPPLPQQFPPQYPPQPYSSQYPPQSYPPQYQYTPLPQYPQTSPPPVVPNLNTTTVPLIK